MQMSAEGIPGFIKIQREVRIFKDYFDMRCKILDDRYTSLLQEMHVTFDALPGRVLEEFLKKMRIEGEKPFSIDDVRNYIGEMLLSSTSLLASINIAITQLKDQQAELI